MNASTRIAQIQARARARRTGVELGRWLPWLVLAVFAAWRLGDAPAATITATVALLLLALRIRQRRRGIDRHWTIRRLDASDPALQDSADLLFADADTLNPLQTLQQVRVQHALQQHAVPDLREPVPWARLRLGILLASWGALALWLWQPRMPASETPAERAAERPADVAPMQSLKAGLQIVPPSYTALPERRLDTIEGEVAQGSELRWELRFAIAPRAVRLRFVEGEVLELAADGGSWRGTRQIDASTLYRIEFDDAPALPERAPYRIDVIPDLPPQLKVLAPERTLTLLDAATARWELQFEASDDYALGAAQLELTLAQGSGEQVTTSTRRIALRGSGDARRQEFRHRIDLAALGFAQGDDLIARLDVRDRREPTANVTRSSSFILRWPPPRGGEGTGVEGLVQQAMPAYFRSQRQIIIDTEALIAERPRLAGDETTSRSDAIGVDQRILRLRYGQFLGEESEIEEAPDGEHGHEDEHAAEPAPAAGDSRALMAAAGHLHDLPEAATLLDPVTKRLLRAALDEMWQAERELRTGNPAAALPYEYRALDYIKRVQQADRIYLARVGLELPQLDASRRLTGERPPAAQRVDPLAPRVSDDIPDAAWQALQRGDALPLDELAAWIAAQRDAIEDPLALLTQIDALRRDPACGDCRARLARQLWPSLTPPAAAPALRPRPDAVGGAYLDALAPTGERP